MKTNLKKNTSFCFLLISLVILNSCKKDFLEVVPKGKVIAQKTSDYESLLNNVEDLVNANLTVHIAMGDDVASINPFYDNSTQTFQRSFRWDAVIYNVDETSEEVQYLMKAIYSYNIIINEVMTSLNGTEQKKKEVRAEALAGRAWCYFNLVNLFAKPYEATTAATDLGWPIIRDADVRMNNFSDRSTVQGVYDFIISDLTAAIGDLSPGMYHRIRMSKPSAQAILGKVYMYMRKFDLALPLLNSSIQTFDASAFKVGLYDYNVEFEDDGVFGPFDPELLGPAILTTERNVETPYGRQTLNPYGLFSAQLVLDPATAALYEDDDNRKKYLFSPSPPFESEHYPGGLLRRWSPLAIQNGVSFPDLLLLRSEAKARLNDLAGAISDVERLRVNRLPEASAGVPAAVASSRVPLLKFIFEERLREFSATGYRWFDMRRLSVDPDLNSTVGYTHKVYHESHDGIVTETFTMPPQRLTLKIPARYLNTNPGMQDNQ